MRLSIKAVFVRSGCGGGIKCRRVVSSRYEWTQLVLENCRVYRVCLSIRVREVVSVGVYKMLSSRLESLRVDTT